MLMDMEQAMELPSGLLEMDSSMVTDMGTDMDILGSRMRIVAVFLFMYLKSPDTLPSLGPGIWQFFQVCL